MYVIKIEHAELCNIYEEEKDEPWTLDRAQQRLVSRYQKSVARQSAAKAINLTYTRILEILREVPESTSLLINQSTPCDYFFRWLIGNHTRRTRYIVKPCWIR